MNGSDIILVRADATVSRGQYSYLTAFAGNASGGVAANTFSAPELYASHEADFLELINGLSLR